MSTVDSLPLILNPASCILNCGLSIAVSTPNCGVFSVYLNAVFTEVKYTVHCPSTLFTLHHQFTLRLVIYNLYPSFAFAFPLPFSSSFSHSSLPLSFSFAFSHPLLSSSSYTLACNPVIPILAFFSLAQAHSTQHRTAKSHKNALKTPAKRHGEREEEMQEGKERCRQLRREAEMQRCREAQCTMSRGREERGERREKSLDQ